MSNRPSVPEIITVNSEQLQSTIRDLLPSQNGFGSELQASNVITPIIDLTATAEGSSLPVSLQQALAFGSQTLFFVGTATTVTLANSPGFYRITAQCIFTGAGTISLAVTDGATVKTIWVLGNFSTDIAQQIDLIVWLAAGESVQATGTSTNNFINGSTRQVGNSQGELVQPNGFPL